MPAIPAQLPFLVSGAPVVEAEIGVLAASMLADLPPLECDPAVGRIYNAIALELDRIRAAAASIATSLVPALADDTYGLLAIHESQLGLPAAPPLTLAQRRALIAARQRASSVAYGSDWGKAFQAALGVGVPWTVRIAGDTITITVPLSVVGVRRQSLLDFLRQITPAHNEISLSYGEGFIVGVSAVGDRI